MGHTSFTVWNTILFTDESWFDLDSHNGRLTANRYPGEIFVDPCVIERRAFAGGSVLVWGGITATGRTALQLVIGNLTVARYRDEILQPHVISFIQNHDNNLTLQLDNVRPNVDSFRTSCNSKMTICWIGQPFLRIYPQLNICSMKWTVDFDDFQIQLLYGRNSVQHLSTSGITFHIFGL